jgi:hypothetical protein
MFSCVNFEARAKIQRLSMWVVMVRERLEIERESIEGIEVFKCGVVSKFE